MERIARYYLTATLFIFGVSFNVFAQEQGPSPKQVEAMERLAFMVGEWKGEGWMQSGPDQRNTSRVTEKMESKAGGMVMAIEGIGKANVNGEEKIVHNAFAVISYDAQNEAYMMRSFLSNGQYVDADIVVEDEKLIWGFEVNQGGKIRYTATLTKEDVWHEIGEFSRDQGATWFQFFEMTLHRVK